MSGVVNSIFGGGGGGAPAAPDYTGAARETAAGNLAAARAAAAANRVSQYTPYGSLEYQQTGTDTQGNPMWAATQGTNPQTQGLINTSLSSLQSSLNNPMYGINPGETYSNAIMQRLQPQQEMQKKQFDAKMANQGIPVGSEAYQNAARQFQQGQNDQLTSAIVGGMQTGLQAQQLQNAQAANVKNLATPNYINPAQQATTAGADILGATNAQYTNQLNAYNAQQARNANTMGGLFGLGAAGLMSPKGTFSGLSGLGSLFGGGGMDASALASGGALDALGGYGGAAAGAPMDSALAALLI